MNDSLRFIGVMVRALPFLAVQGVAARLRGDIELTFEVEGHHSDELRAFSHSVMARCRGYDPVVSYSSADRKHSGSVRLRAKADVRTVVPQLRTWVQEVLPVGTAFRVRRLARRATA